MVDIVLSTFRTLIFGEFLIDTVRSILLGQEDYIMIITSLLLQDPNLVHMLS